MQENSGQTGVECFSSGGVQKSSSGEKRSSMNIGYLIGVDRIWNVGLENITCTCALVLPMQSHFLSLGSKYFTCIMDSFFR